MTKENKLLLSMVTNMIFDGTETAYEALITVELVRRALRKYIGLPVEDIDSLHECLLQDLNSIEEPSHGLV